MELWMPDLPGRERRSSRTQEHPGLGCHQCRRRTLVPDQRLPRPATAGARNAAAASQGSSRDRPASPLADRGRDPDQWRDRCGYRAVVDAGRLALFDLRSCQGAGDPESQQHLRCAERKECPPRANRARPAVRACAARRFAVRHRGPTLHRAGKGRVVPGGQGAPGRQGRGRRHAGASHPPEGQRQISLLPGRLRRGHRRSEVTARGRRADPVRWHGVARRRTDRGRAWHQDRAEHGTYRDVGRPRRDRNARRARYRPKAVPAYQQFQPGLVARIGRAQDRGKRGLANPRRRDGDRAVNVVPTTGMTALSIGKGISLNSASELEATLRQIGATRYHSLHPFHKLLHGGKLNKGQVQAWALNRYYYQSTIPLKDAVVMSRFRDRATRLEWRHRIEDHDGDVGREGGIERWLKLTEGLGLDRAYVESTEGILPGTRFAVEAYVHFCRERTPLEAIASSLTELFAPSLHEERIAGMLQHYDFVNPDIMSYFSRRLAQAPRDAGFALEYVREHATTPEQRELVCNALIFKTNVLWVQLDALYHAYVEGHIPPGAFVPKTT